MIYFLSRPLIASIKFLKRIPQYFHNMFEIACISVYSLESDTVTFTLLKSHREIRYSQHCLSRVAYWQGNEWHHFDRWLEGIELLADSSFNFTISSPWFTTRLGVSSPELKLLQYGNTVWTLSIQLRQRSFFPAATLTRDVVRRILGTRWAS